MWSVLSVTSAFPLLAEALPLDLAAAERVGLVRYYDVIIVGAHTLVKQDDGMVRA